MAKKISTDRRIKSQCHYHAQLGMVGQVTVGNGTDDPVQQAIEDEEVPSLGFVFGSLVLVGAAGLRRRIH